MDPCKDNKYGIMYFEDIPFSLEISIPIDVNTVLLDGDELGNCSVLGHLFATKWSVVVKRRGTAGDSWRNEISISLRASTKPNIHARVNFRIQQGESYPHKEDDTRCFSADSKPVRYYFATLGNRKNSENRHAFTIAGYFVVKSERYRTPGAAQLLVMDSSSKLSNDLHSMFASKFLSDMTFDVQGTKLRAHQSILAARSEVFAAMFKHEMLEKLSGCIKIEDFDESIIESMLTYIYTGQPPRLDCESAVKLFAAAEKYALLELKEMCELYLTSMLNAENAVDVLLLADTHCAASLKRMAIETICGNAKTFQDGKLYSRVADRPDLMLELLRSMTCAASKK